MDELDLLITYTATSEEYNDAESVDRATIYQYEDVDQCGQYDILLAQTTKPNILGCKVKTEGIYSDASELPDELL